MSSLTGAAGRRPARALPRSPEDSRLARRLRRMLRGTVHFDRATRVRYATDASMYRIEPVGVVMPADDTDVVATFELAREAGVPVLPRGAGTSLAGQAIGEALVLDHSRQLNRILRFDPRARTIEVQPGVVLDSLNAFLRPHGLWFPVDVISQSQATIGGMAGNNSSGPRSIRYGNMVHNVTGIDALLSDGSTEYFGPFGTAAPRPLSSARSAALVSRLFAIGQRERGEIAQMWPRLLRRIGGYSLDVFHPQSPRPYTSDGSVNLAHLLVGSEGTLAWFRRITLALAPLPAARRLAIAHFSDGSAALRSVHAIVDAGASAVEYLDESILAGMLAALQDDLLMPTARRARWVTPGKVDSSARPFRPAPDSADAAAMVQRALESARARRNRVRASALLIEFEGDDEAELQQRCAGLNDLIAAARSSARVLAIDGEPAQDLTWQAYRRALHQTLSRPGTAQPLGFIDDCAVALPDLPAFAADVDRILARHGVEAIRSGPVSAGVLRTRPILVADRAGARTMRAIADETALLVRRYRGAFSGENGDGIARSERVNWQFGERLERAFEEIKDTFDPAHLLNPGKIVRPPQMNDERLFRRPPDPAVPLPETALDWSAWGTAGEVAAGSNERDSRDSRDRGNRADRSTAAVQIVHAEHSVQGRGDGFARAVAACDGNGLCRQFDAGAMCPSWRVTRDEQHLTRGRAHTLQDFLSAGIPDPARTDGEHARRARAAYDALELCVGCKACRRECPAGVDMTRMKIEFLHDWNRTHRLSRRDRLFAWLPRYAHHAARWRGLLHLRDVVPGLAWLSERWLGLTTRRPLPRWRGDPFSRDVFADDPDRTANADGMTPPTEPKTGSGIRPSGAAAGIASASAPFAAREVVLWTDTFNNWFEPDNLRAARTVLRAAGYQVRLVRALPAQDPRRPLCCGRTFLSRGLVDEARVEAQRTLAALAPWIERGIPVIGLEPSCLLTMRDEFLALGLGESAAKLAGNAWLLEDFLVREQRAGRLTLELHAIGHEEALLHGHCHQKAFDAMSAVHTVLDWIPGLSVREIGGSCCGMSEGFGYDARHHDLSMQMGELTLLPAVRQAPERTLIVTDGSACRCQIRDGAQRKAVHVARVLEQALAP